MDSFHTATPRSRGIAASGSLIFHGIAAVLIILAMRGCGSGGEGIQYMSLSIASLGEFEQGLGDPTETPASSSQPQPQEETPETEEQVETVEESPVTAPKPSENPKPKPKPVEKPVEKPVVKPAEKPQQPSNALNNALNQLGKPGSSSGQTQSGGNEGAPDGKIEGKGVFSGGGGNGEWALSGRNLRSKPKLDERPSDEGTVVVDIWVDKSGNVIKAQANPAKSNTNKADLYSLAEKAAKSAKFSASEAAGQQKGTITIIFKLN